MPRRNPELAAAIGRAHALACAQQGVCTSQQAQACGVPAREIGRLVESGRWHALQRGVYLMQPGPAPFLSLLWAAHLALGPTSVVAGRAAARYWGLADADPHVIEMLQSEPSRRRARGVRSQRVPDPLALAHPARQPPVLTVEHTVLAGLAHSATDAAAVELVLRACRSRLTTPDRLLAAAGSVSRLRRRLLLQTLCADVRHGVTSPLERAYQDQVCRPHGLPVGRGQAVVTGPAGRRLYRDVHYEDQRVIVELDGRLGHEAESDVLRDQDRDNQATLTGQATLRFGWLAVLGHRCAVADQVVHLLQLRGWTGSARPCRADCRVAGPPRLGTNGGRFVTPQPGTSGSRG